MDCVNKAPSPLPNVTSTATRGARTYANSVAAYTQAQVSQATDAQARLLQALEALEGLRKTWAAPRNMLMSLVAGHAATEQDLVSKLGKVEAKAADVSRALCVARLSAALTTRALSDQGHRPDGVAAVEHESPSSNSSSDENKNIEFADLERRSKTLASTWRCKELLLKQSAFGCHRLQLSLVSLNFEACTWRLRQREVAVRSDMEGLEALLMAVSLPGFQNRSGLM